MSRGSHSTERRTVNSLATERAHWDREAMKRSSRYVRNAVHTCHRIACSLCPRKLTNWSVCLICLTPFEYARRLRLRFAATLLWETDLTVAEQ